MALSLHYLIREPKIKSDKNPLLLLLHGYGSNEQDLFSFASELPDEYYIVSARAPYDMSYGSYAWYSINFTADQKKFSDEAEAVKSRDKIAGFIDELLEAYPIDKDDVTLIGFSQGTILSYAVALSYPSKVRRVGGLSGYLNEDIIDYGSHEEISKLKIFASHGTMDQVIPVSWSAQAPQRFNEMKIDNVFKQYPIGHGVNPQNFSDLLQWLKSTSNQVSG